MCCCCWWLQAEDVISLTQQLQLLHVTKEFQQLVKGSNTNAATAAKAAGGGGSGHGQSAANKEVQSLENLLQVLTFCSMFAFATQQVIQATNCRAVTCCPNLAGSQVIMQCQHTRLSLQLALEGSCAVLCAISGAGDTAPEGCG